MENNAKEFLLDLRTSFFSLSATVRQTMLRNNTKYALRVANPQVADRLARGWAPEGRIVMTP
jgi:hypothetical protein